jgi:putative endonuclease
MEDYFVYAISSLNRNYIYVGLSSNLEQRFKRHNDGYEKTTKPYAPFRLIYTENCSDRPSARIREKYWKSGIGKEKLRKIRDQIDAGLSLDR